MATETSSPANRGWTVTAVGNAREVTDLSDISDVRGTGLENWAAAEDDQFFAITPEIISGQMLLVSSQSQPSRPAEPAK